MSSNSQFEAIFPSFPNPRLKPCSLLKFAAVCLYFVSINCFELFFFFSFAIALSYGDPVVLLFICVKCQQAKETAEEAMVQELMKEKQQREHQLKAMEDLKQKEAQLKQEFEEKQVC